MEPWESFDEHFVLRLVGQGLWQAFNKSTMTPASPRYNNKEAAIHYVQQEMKAEMEASISAILGKSDEHIRN